MCEERLRKPLMRSHDMERLIRNAVGLAAALGVSSLMFAAALV